MRWQIETAPSEFPKLVEKALSAGPQIVTRQGEDAVVVLSVDEYRRLTEGGPSFKQLLASAPLDDIDLERSAD